MIQIGRQIDLQRVPRDHLEAPRIMRRDLLQRRQAAGIALDGNDPRGALGQQRPGQPAGPWPDLDHRHARQRPANSGNSRRQVQVHQEVLPQRLLRRQTMTCNHLAQRRQSVCRQAAHAARRAAIAAARFSASIKLLGLALPLPAMS